MPAVATEHAEVFASCFPMIRRCEKDVTAVMSLFLITLKGDFPGCLIALPKERGFSWSTESWSGGGHTGMDTRPAQMRSSAVRGKT